MCLVERLGSAGSLRHLTFWNLPIVPGWLEQVALALPNLQSLSVSAISSHDTAEGTTFSAELSKALPHLRRLRYLQCTPEGLVIENSASSQPLFASTLKVLHLRTLGSSQPADARRSTSLTAALAEQAKQLEILCLEDWLDSKGLVNVARLKNLTYLDVNIHSSCIQQYGQMLRALPKLRAVGLSGQKTWNCHDGDERSEGWELSCREVLELVGAVVENAPQIEHFSTPDLACEWDASGGVAYIRRLAELNSLISLDFCQYDCDSDTV